MEQSSKYYTVVKSTADDDTFHFIGLHGAPAIFVLVVFCLLALVLLLVLLRKFIQGPRYCKKNRIDDKVVIVTGCNTGIGKETVLELARRGAKIYMACRNWELCEAARLEIIEKTQNEKIYNRTLDLGSLASVRQFAAQFLCEESRLDILINNAGIMATPRKLTVDGYEQQFAVNHLGHFLLTLLLLERLKQSAPSRIVIVSSSAYMLGKINKKDLMGEKHYSKFVGAYSQSKLANLLFMRKLVDDLKGTGVTVNSLHPGIVRTELHSRHNTCSRCCFSIFWALSGFFMKSPKAGAQTTLRLALDPCLEKSTGGYYEDSKRYPLMCKAKDEKMADWLWEESERLVGLREKSAVEVVTVKN